MAEEENQEEAEEATPQEGEIEEAVKDTGLGESPEEAANDEPSGDDQT